MKNDKKSTSNSRELTSIPELPENSDPGTPPLADSCV
jgi:hypothetical protein